MFPIVGVGASAGGLEAFTQLLKKLPTKTGMAFVLVQHLDPAHESALTELLGRVTSMPVTEVTDNLRVEPDHIYVIPPNTAMEIRDGGLKLRPRGALARGAQHSIDSFFESLAQDRCEKAIGVVLSGSASDGTLGLEAIKSEGGITFAQDESAKFDSMPRSAIAAGCVDYVLAPEAIAAELARIAQHPLVTGAAELSKIRPPEREREADQREGPEAALASGGKGRPDTGSDQARKEADSAGEDSRSIEEAGFKKILLLLRNHCGVDFSFYKSSTIQRRVARRIVLNHQKGHGDYAMFLKGNAKELDALYSDVLISVTSFFRNPEAFETLKRRVFPALVAQSGRDSPIRVWTLGCSTGQEAYSIAISYAEFAEKNFNAPRLQVFATDLNDALLHKARHGLYAKTLAEDVSPERLRRFFVEEQGGYRVGKALREQVVFARQNVMSDPPFSRMDLISCRNLLIYLEPGLQKKIMPAFHYALKPGGFLFLGASESIGTFTDLFEPADKKQKIFSRKNSPSPSFRLPLPPHRLALPEHPASSVTRAAVRSERAGMEFDAQREADRLLVSQYAPPAVVINADLQVLQFRGATGAYLEPPVGKPSFDLLKMARDGLMLPLRSAINQARRENKPVLRQNVRMERNGDHPLLQLQVIPLKNLTERCYLVLFEEVPTGSRRQAGATRTIAKQLPTGKNSSSRRIAELEREIAEAREYQQSVEERSEASAEELQASSEELQSANEELQSINEELETSKEELESTNEELVTLNDEMQHRNLDLKILNDDLNNLHVSINTAILVVAKDLTIRRFTVQAEKVFNLRLTDIGRPMSAIRHNLDCRDLDDFVRDVIDTVSTKQREVRDKEGRWYSLRARPYLTTGGQIDGAVLVLVDIDALKGTERALQQNEGRYRTLFDLGPVAIYSCDAAGVIQDYNLRAAELWGRRPRPNDPAERYCGSFKLVRPDGGFLPHDECPVAQVLNGKVREKIEGEVQIERQDGTRISVNVNIAPLFDAQGEVSGAINCFVDITERKKVEEALALSARAKDDFLATLSHELRTPLTPVLVTAAALREDDRLPADAREQLGMVERNIILEARLIDDLLDVTKIAHGKLSFQAEACDSHALIEHAIEMVRYDSDAKNLTIESNLVAPHHQLLVDPARFQQLIWNLLRNAVKFTPSGGRITVSTREQRTAQKERQLRVEVTDTGIGIDPTRLESIFLPFDQGGLTGAARLGGVGLGLAISRAVVELHAGRISAHSLGAHRGATFVVELPG